MDKRKRNIIFIGILVLVLSVISFTYAIWSAFFEQKDPNLLATSCFQLSFKEDENFDMITLQKAHPITEEEGLQLNPYKFTITNNCQDYAAYEIHLEIDEDSNLSDFNAVHVSLDQESFILGSKQVVTTTLENATTAYSLTKGYLNKGESKDFELRMWIDEDADASIAGQQFLSQVTLTASYLEEEKVPPTVDLELALCGNTITATGRGEASGNKSITKYEFRLDDEEEWENNSGSNTKEFTVEDSKKHTVGMKVTDSNGITSEVTKEIQQETVNIYGKDIPVTSCGDGLYEVEHNDSTLEEGWKTEEYRYAGTNVNNYVWFNCGPGASSGKTCEKWRIIGLVNVKTTNGIEQRLKIIRDESIGNYAWDRDTSFTNDWTRSKLMEMLNDGYYYSSSSVSCYKGGIGSSSSQTTCQFDGTDSRTKGLEESARAMIDTDITWNIGGWSTSEVKTAEMYKYERGTKTGNSDANPAEWNSTNTMAGATFNSVGLMYLSDYGYASAGSNSNDGKTRSDCINDTKLYSYNTSGCYEKDWLLTEELREWFLLPNSSSYFPYAFYLDVSGFVSSLGAYISYAVRPVVYLTSKAKIVDNSNDGSYDKPYELELTE